MSAMAEHNRPERALQIVSLSIYPEGIRHRLMKGLGAYFIGQMINLLSRILLAPLFAKMWGVDVYGEWLLLSSFVSYLTLADMGGGHYIVNRLTQAYAKQDIHLFRKILHTGLMLSLSISGAVFLIFVIAILIISPASFLQISKTNHQTVIWVLAVLAFQFLFTLPQGILLGVYHAIGMLPRRMMLANLIQLLQLILVFCGLWLSLGMAWIVSLQAIPCLLVMFIAILELTRRFPKSDMLSFKDAELAIGLTFIKPSLYFFLLQIVQAFSIQGTVLIVGILLGSINVVLFSTVRTIVSTMRQFLSMMANTACPEMTRLDAEQNLDKLYILFRLILRSTMVAAVVFITIFHFYGRTIFHLWMGDAVEYRQMLMDLFLVYVLQGVFWMACGSLLMAINNHHTLSKVLFGSSLLTIVLVYLGGRYFALDGIVIGMIVGDLLMPLWMIPYLLNKYHAQFSLMFYAKEIVPIIGALTSVVLHPWSTPIACLILFVWWLRCLPGQYWFLRRWAWMRNSIVT